MIQLHRFGPTRSLRVLWALNEPGVEYEFISVNLLAGEHRTSGFLGVNPAGKLPGLLDGFPNLQAYLQRMYARPTAPPRIAAAFAELGGEVDYNVGTNTIEPGAGSGGHSAEIEQ